MTRTTYKQCRFCGDFHDVHNWPDNHREWVPDNRSELAAPSIINDNLDYVQSMADGKRYTSKRELSREYRRQGFAEVGNEDPGAHRAKPDKRAHRQKVEGAVKRAASQVAMRKPSRVMTPKKARQARQKDRANG